MDLRKVLFIGGNPDRLASVRVRCVDIAYRLGCDCIFKIGNAEDIPRCYQAFVCVKSSFDQVFLNKLRRRGLIIWDVIDALPPRRGIDVYLTSSLIAQKCISIYGRTDMIRNHHCNNSKAPNAVRHRRPAWIGSRHWCPRIPNLKFEKYFMEGLSQEQIVGILQKVGIGLNLRYKSASRSVPDLEQMLREFHISINPGIKLINTIGFGTPSISEDEPAYHEIDEGCTIFSNAGDCAMWVKELQANDRLYNRMRRNCIKVASKYHIDSIVQEYRNFFKTL